MNIDNPNTIFKLVSITFTEEWEVARFETILTYAMKHIDKTEYVYNEQELRDMINQLSKAILAKLT